MSLTYSTTELCSSPLSPSHNSHGGRFYNPHRSSRSLRSALGGPEHAPWSAPTAQTLPECQRHPLRRAQRSCRGQVPMTTPTCPAILPQGQRRHLQPLPSLSPVAPQLHPMDPAQRSAPLTPRHSAQPRPPVPVLPNPTQKQTKPMSKRVLLPLCSPTS